MGRTMDKESDMKQSNYMGDYCHLIRVNGQRSVVGLGHTQQEAYRNALDLARHGLPWQLCSILCDLQHIAKITIA